MTTSFIDYMRLSTLAFATSLAVAATYSEPNLSPPAHEWTTMVTAYDVFHKHGLFGGSFYYDWNDLTARYDFSLDPDAYFDVVTTGCQLWEQITASFTTGEDCTNQKSSDNAHLYSFFRKEGFGPNGHTGACWGVENLDPSEWGICFRRPLWMTTQFFINLHDRDYDPEFAYGAGG